MIQQDSDLFDDIYNTMNEHNQRQIHYLSLILNYLDVFFLNDWKSSFISSSVSSLTVISMLSLLNALDALHHYHL